MKDNKFWTLRYTLINITYFAVFCTIHAYAAVFLLDKGLTNTMVGLSLALANLLSAFAQPIVAGFVDKPNKITNRRVMMASAFLMEIGSVILLTIRTNIIIICITFVLIYMIQFMYQPMMIAMNFEYQQASCKINFGLSRGLGSAGFAVTAALIGPMVSQNGTDMLLYITLIMLAIHIILIYFFKLPKDYISPVTDSQSDNKRSNSLLDFAKNYPIFILFLVGTVFCFIGHNAINDFLISIIRNLGGNEAHLGYANFLAAILELPVMALMGLILKKISARKALIFSGISFCIKIAIMMLATSLMGMFISQSFQAFAYAVFIPASAIFADNLMHDNDKAKGQAYINSAITIGGVFSSLISGKILDLYGVFAMLLLGLLISIVGAIIITVSSCLIVKKPTHS